MSWGSFHILLPGAFALGPCLLSLGLCLSVIITPDEAQRAIALARESRGDYMGLDVRAFVDGFRAFAASRPEIPDERPRIALT